VAPPFFTSVSALFSKQAVRKMVRTALDNLQSVEDDDRQRAEQSSEAAKEINEALNKP
jgi:hypothetical protein